MTETVQARIMRLMARKNELLGQIKEFRANPNMRNAEFKADRLHEQVIVITDKIVELKEKEGA